MIECTLLVEKNFFKSYNMYINKKEPCGRMTLSEIMSIVDNAQSLNNVETKHHLKSVKTLLDGVFCLPYLRGCV